MPAPTRASQPSLTRTALIAAALIALSPLTLAMYGPSMPAMATAFTASKGAVQATLTVYLVAFALAQLVYGPLADRYGRRPVVLAGLAIYLAGCLVGGLAQSIEQMLAARVLEGIGACGGSAASRAFVQDRFQGRAAARVFSLTGIALAVAPAAGPALAGILQRDLGWQGIFIALGAAAALLLLALWLVMPETLPVADRRALRPRELVRAHARILGRSEFLGPALLLALSGAGTYYYVALAPFLLIRQLGVAPEDFGLLMPLLMLGYLAASALAALLVKRTGSEALVLAGLLAGLLGALLLCFLLQLGGANVPRIMAALVFWMVGIALITPGVTAAALTPFAGRTGRAAATLGFLQMLGSGLGALADWASGPGAVGLAPPLFLLLGALAWRLLQPRVRPATV